MEICCKKCGEIIDWFSDDDFLILFEKNLQHYFCFGCIFDYQMYEVPCGDCKFYEQNDWLGDRCKIHGNESYLICLEKELKKADSLETKSMASSLEHKTPMGDGGSNPPRPIKYFKAEWR